MSSVYHNIKLHKNHLTSQQFNFSLAGTDSPDYHLELYQQDMFQGKIDEIFKGLPQVFGIADDILIVGFDADDRDDDRMSGADMPTKT